MVFASSFAESQLENALEVINLLGLYYELLFCDIFPVTALKRSRNFERVPELGGLYAFVFDHVVCRFNVVPRQFAHTHQ